MKEKIEQIIDRNTEGNYLLSSTDKAQMVSEILDLVGVTDPLLADFLKYAIDDTMRISGDHDGLAGTTFVGDTYEKIASDYISICSDRLTSEYKRGV